MQKEHHTGTTARGRQQLEHSEEVIRLLPNGTHNEPESVLTAMAGNHRCEESYRSISGNATERVRVLEPSHTAATTPSKVLDFVTDARVADSDWADSLISDAV